MMGAINSPGNAPASSPSARWTPSARPSGRTTRSRRTARAARPSGDGYVKPDLVAPGNRITSLAAPGSTLYLDCPELRVGTGHLTLSGTSQATAVVAAPRH